MYCFLESFLCRKRLDLTPDYFGDAMVTRTNYDYILELRDLGQGNNKGHRI